MKLLQEKRKIILSIFIELVMAAIIFWALSSSLLIENSLTNLLGERFVQLVFLAKLITVFMALSISIFSFYSFSLNRWLRMLLFIMIFTLFTLIRTYELAFVTMAQISQEIEALRFQHISDYVQAFIALVFAMSAMVHINRKLEKNRNINIILLHIFGIVMLLFGYMLFGESLAKLMILKDESLLSMLEILFIFIGLTGYVMDIIRYPNKNINYMIIGLFFYLMVIITYGGLAVLTPYQQFIKALVEMISLLLILRSIFAFTISKPFEQLNKARNQVDMYAKNLEKLIERRSEELSIANDKLFQEIEYAKRIQQSLLPTKTMHFDKVSFISDYIPCERLSGDFYDIYPIDNENIGMYILDVSGHGISASLMTMFCNNYVKSTERLIMRYRGLKPHRNLQHFYEEFNKMHFPDEMHMVIIFASYNMEEGILTYSNGGINVLPIIVRVNGHVEYLDQSEGFPICKMGDFFTPTYSSAKVKLHTGDRVIFYTDGLVEKLAGQYMTKEDIISIMINHIDDPLHVLNEELRSRIPDNQGDLEDDITYFIMEVKE